MKFLVLGSCGMVGHTISLYLKEQGHDVMGFDRNKSMLCKSIVGDVRDTEGVRTFITKGKFDFVINCIGILNQFAEQNKELAAFLNAYFPHFLVSATSETNTQLIHLSTDCVFSGNRGAYVESDLRDGETFYDRSKGMGEIEDDRNITFRNSLIGPDISPEGIGLLNWFMKQHGTITGYTKAIWTGLTTLELAKVIEAAAKEKVHGLYNMVYHEAISKYDLLKLFNRYMRNGRMKIVTSEVLVLDKSLKRTRFDFKYIIPDYETMVVELEEWIRIHKKLYPHYNL